MACKSQQIELNTEEMHVKKENNIMSIITKTELVTQIASKTELTSASADKVITAFFDAITEALKEGSEVRFIGFGTFSVQSVAARTGRNPRTGEVLQIKASKKPVFKAGKTLKDALNS
jgi:DNA-binding protein HU-beta